MAPSLRFDDPYIPVPPAAIDTDPAAAMRELFFRVARLEHSLREQRVLAAAEMAEVILSQVAIADELARVVEGIGVPTNAQNAMLARGVAALGRQIMEDLRERGVTPIETLGKPPDPDHSDVVGYEDGAGVAEGTVIVVWFVLAIGAQAIVLLAAGRAASAAATVAPVASTSPRRSAHASTIASST